MRFTKTMLATAVALTFMSNARAGEPITFVPASSYEIAQRADTQPPRSAADQEAADREQDRRDRQEARRDRAEARRERATARREDARDDREAAPPPQSRFWVGVGAGVGVATISVTCAGANSNTHDCDQSGDLGTYSANITIAGPYTALRVRGVRQQDKGDDKQTPYEEAVLIGSRFGRSNWYGLAGVGRLQHIDDKHYGDTHGFAWEILFAPSSLSAMGMEVSFQGELGDDVDYVGANLGLRFGQLR